MSGSTTRRYAPCLIGGLAAGLLLCSATTPRCAASSGSPGAGAAPAAAPTSNSFDLAIVPEPDVTLVSPARAQYAIQPRSALDLSPLEHTFTLRNSHPVPMVLDRIETGCGCTSALIGDQKSLVLPVTVGPGQELRLRVAVDPSDFSSLIVRRGTAVAAARHISKVVWLFTAAQSPPIATLEITGDITPAVSFSVPAVSFGQTPIGTLRELPLQVTLDRMVTESGAHFRLVSSNPNIKIIPEPAPKKPLMAGGATSQSYLVAVSSKAPLGALNGSLSLVQVDGKPLNLPDTSLPIVGEVVGELTGTPSAVQFGTVGAGHTITQEIELHAASPQAFRSIRITSGSPYLTARLNPINATQPDMRFLVVSLKANAPAGDLKSVVMITTASHQRLVFPIVATVIR